MDLANGKNTDFRLLTALAADETRRASATLPRGVRHPDTIDFSTYDSSC
jgi:hypothetical protein